MQLNCLKPAIAQAMPAASQVIEAPPFSCPSGYAKTGWANLCTPCALGTYQWQSGQTSCITCPSGKSNCATGAQYSTSCTTPQTCQPGWKRSSSSVFCCEGCVYNTYSAFANQASCNACPSGQYTRWPRETSSSACLSCPAGKVKCSGVNGMYACPSSSMTLNQPQTPCISCPAGYYSASAGATQCSECPAGTVSQYSAAFGITACSTCPTGKSRDSARTTCLCPAGKYQSNWNWDTACQSCPANKISSGTCAGGTGCCTTCPNGKRPNPLQTACI